MKTEPTDLDREAFAVFGALPTMRVFDGRRGWRRLDAMDPVPCAIDLDDDATARICSVIAHDKAGRGRLKFERVQARRPADLWIAYLFAGDFGTEPVVFDAAPLGRLALSVVKYLTQIVTEGDK